MYAITYHRFEPFYLHSQRGCTIYLPPLRRQHQRSYREPNKRSCKLSARVRTLCLSHPMLMHPSCTDSTDWTTFLLETIDPGPFSINREPTQKYFTHNPFLPHSMQYLPAFPAEQTEVGQDPNSADIFHHQLLTITFTQIQL